MKEIKKKKKWIKKDNKKLIQNKEKQQYQKASAFGWNLHLQLLCYPCGITTVKSDRGFSHISKFSPKMATITITTKSYTTAREMILNICGWLISAVKSECAVTMVIVCMGGLKLAT